MKIFLIRHAKGNAQNGCWQQPSTPLGDIGLMQAKKLSKLTRFNDTDFVISSTLQRGLETANILVEKIKVPIISTNLVDERRQSNKIYGQNFESEIGKNYRDSFNNSGNKIVWKFDATEESVDDVTARAIKFANILIKEYKGSNIAIVSHDIFIRAFIATCILNKQENDSSFQKLFNSLSVNNCGITLMEFSEDKSMWKILYFNDFSYLFH